MQTTIQEDLAEAKRHFTISKQVYPKWILLGKITKEEAATRLARAESIVARLQKLQWLHEVSEEMKSNDARKSNLS